MSGPGVNALGVKAVGVVVPVRNEDEHLEACLDAVAASARVVIEAGIGVEVVTVLDGCVDASAQVAASTMMRWSSKLLVPRLKVLTIAAGNVGAARAAGCEQVMTTTGWCSLDHLWLATTDADSRVPADWLVHQLACRASGADAWVGIVEVHDTGVYPPAHLQAFRDWYRRWSGPCHPHVHGANLGFTARAYCGAGGFGPLTTGEDHDIVRRLVASGAVVNRGVGAPVVTSDRSRGRAPEGFAGALETVSSPR